MATSYTYQPLLPGEIDHIRIVTIHPGSGDDDIVIALDVVPFSRKEPPSYEALSYTWGPAEDPARIYILPSQNTTVDGERNKSTLSVTQNLNIALKNLRLVDTPRTMWIDALCIDQQNNEEKSREVQRMNSIYLLARRVVVWLGPASDDSDRTVTMMERVGDMLQVNWYFQNIRFVNAKHHKGPIAVPFDAQDLTGYYHIICRSWFERLWIRQEITLANSDAVVFCGEASILWSTFRKALVGIYAIFSGAAPGVASCDPSSFKLATKLRERGQRLYRFFWQDPHVYFSDSKTLFSGSDCFDPRDRIYAMIHLLREELNITPDYSLTVWEVYEDAVLRYLQKRRFDFLQMSQVSHLTLTTFTLLPEYGYANSREENSSSMNAQFHPALSVMDLGDYMHETDHVYLKKQLQVPPQLGPTWIPDWSTPSPGDQKSTHYIAQSTSQLAAWYRKPSAGMLGVAGVKVLTIDDIQPGQVTNSDSIGIFQQVRDILKGLISLGKLSNVDKDHEIVARTFLSGKTFHSEKPPNINLPNLDDAKRVVSMMMSPDYVCRVQDFPAGTGVRKTISRMWNFLIGAHVFTAGPENIIGIARGPIQPGDQVYVLIGCNHSVVLRKVPDSSQNNFQHVGECFVHHVSQGQALLGPLPENIEHIHADLSGAARYYRDVFINRVTGEITRVDPRFATSLPPAMVTRFEEWIEHDEDNRILVDPEVLRRPGVDIEILNLV